MLGIHPLGFEYEYKTKNGESLSTFSVSVARPGIEPGTS